MKQPKYEFGQKVKVEIDTFHEPTKKYFKNKIIGVISVIKAVGTSRKDTYTYGITTDMPRCYHLGSPPFTFILEDDIEIVN